MRAMHRRCALALIALSGVGFLAIGCGGATSTLHTLGTPTGKGDVQLDVENKSGSIVNNLYLAPTDKVRAAPRSAFQSGEPAQAELWGEDRLASGLAVGAKARVPIPAPGRYDVRVLDREGNEQHIGGLKLAAGGRYVLELGSGSWRQAR
jgi:hypothetical protein